MSRTFAFHMNREMNEGTIVFTAHFPPMLVLDVGSKYDIEVAMDTSLYKQGAIWRLFGERHLELQLFEPFGQR